MMMHEIEETPVLVWTGAEMLEGILRTPESPHAVVVFVHAAAHSRYQPANRALASRMQQAGYATLVVDLLTADEEQFDSRTGHFRSNAELLAGRLRLVTAWIHRNHDTRHLPVALFASGTGASAAFRFLADDPEGVFALVTRDGRPEFAADVVGQVRVPTMLIAGVLDFGLVSRNRAAFDAIHDAKRLEIVGDATQNDRVAHEACEWFRTHLPRAAAAAITRGEAKGAREEDCQRIMVIDGFESLGYRGEGHEEHSGEPGFVGIVDFEGELADNEPSEVMADFAHYVA